MYVNRAKDEAVVFVFLRSNSFAHPVARVRLDGLEDHSLYTIEGEEQPISGKALKQVGLKLNLIGDYDSTVIRINRAG